jgi:elongation factor Ts
MNVSVNAGDVKRLREKTGAGIMDCKKALMETGGNMDGAIKYLKEKGLADAKKRSGRKAKDGKVAVSFSSDGNRALMAEVNCETDFVSRTPEYEGFVQELADQLLHEGVSDVQGVSEPVKSKVKDGIANFGENIILRKIALFEKSDPVKSVFQSYIHLVGKVGVIAEFLLHGDGLAERAEVQELMKNVSLQIASMGPLSVSRDDFPEQVLDEQREIFMTQARESGKPEAILEKIVQGRINKFFADSCLLEQKYVRDGNLTIKQYIDDVAQKVKGGVEVKRFARFKLGEE